MLKSHRTSHRSPSPLLVGVLPDYHWFRNDLRMMWDCDPIPDMGLIEGIRSVLKILHS